MKYAVISDLHIGPGDLVDQFGHNEILFIKFLDFLESKHDKIILLGDIFETLMPRKFRCCSIMLNKCLNTYPKIWERFQSDKYIYIFGNHDFIAQNICKARECYSDISGKDKILFIHGHQFDSINRYLKITNELGLFIAGWSLRLGAKSIYKKIEKLQLFSENEILFQKEAINFIKRNNFDIIITGHTHNPTILHYDDKIFMNSGSCCNGKFNYLSIDTVSQKYIAYAGFNSY